VNYRRITVGLALALALLGCRAGHPEGPAGEVVDRSAAYDPATKTTAHHLTTEAGGRRSTFQVHVTAYTACPIGAAYPRCAR